MNKTVKTILWVAVIAVVVYFVWKYVSKPKVTPLVYSPTGVPSTAMPAGTASM